ncbi:MAG TPA: hypothetical protein VIL55_01840 [Naasia sp.]
MIVLAADVTISNSVICGADGAGSAHMLVDALAGAPRLRIIDTEIAATVPNLVNGVMGSNFALLRVNIHSVIDQVHIVGGNVTISDSRLHGNLHYENDPSHGGGPSHDDNVQIQAGSNIRISGNILSGSHNAAVQVTQARGPVTGLVIENNRIDNGACSINIAENGRGPVGLSLTGNTFGRTMRFGGCAVIAPVTTPVNGLGSNSFTDGAAIAVTPAP